MSDKVLVNTRVLQAPLSGVQRYTGELLRRLSDVQRIQPRTSLGGIRGHVWEQVILPAHVKDRVLWSPSNTGPLAVSRQLVTIHDVASLDHPEWFAERFASWYGWLTPRLVRRAARIIAVSQFTAERLNLHTSVDPASIAIVPPGVDSRFARTTKSARETAREIVGVGRRPYLLTVATREPRKNLDRLLRAWTEAQEQLDPDIVLVVAGARGSSRIFGLPEESRAPRTLFAGHVAEPLLPGLVAGAAAFAFVSLYEGFGLPPLEAASAGVPVLASRAGAIPEILGDAALLVDPHSIEEIAVGIRRILEDRALRERLRSAGVLRARHFTWDESARRLQGLFQSI